MISIFLSLFCLSFWIKVCKDWLTGMRHMTILKNYTKVVPLIDFPLISVIVPACNEEKKIRMTIESLLAQEYPNLQIIAVNDRSTDSTGKVLNDLSKKHSSLKVIHIESLPPDWLGKNHALYSGASYAQGEWLLFTDADIFFERSSIQLAFNYAYAHHLDHLTMAPDVIVSGIWLKTFVNAFSLIFSLLVRPWLAKDSTKKDHVGIGAFNLMKRSVYNAIGGHLAIHLRPDDDIKIAKLVKKYGFKQDIVIGKDLLQVEWYENVPQAAKGLEKNSLSGADYKMSRMFLATLLLFITNVYPWIGIWTGPLSSRILFGISLLIFLALFGYHVKYIQSPVKSHFWDAFLHPMGMLIVLFIMNRACLKTFFQGGIEWRGTKYSLETLKRNVV
jgi:glycosyltransferase involved in cell wall biosynthesis